MKEKVYRKTGFWSFSLLTYHMGIRSATSFTRLDASFKPAVPWLSVWGTAAKFATKHPLMWLIFYIFRLKSTTPLFTQNCRSFISAPCPISGWFSAHSRNSFSACSLEAASTQTDCWDRGKKMQKSKTPFHSAALGFFWVAVTQKVTATSVTSHLLCLWLLGKSKHHKIARLFCICFRH